MTCGSVKLSPAALLALHALVQAGQVQALSLALQLAAQRNGVNPRIVSAGAHKAQPVAIAYKGREGVSLIGGHVREHTRNIASPLGHNPV